MADGHSVVIIGSGPTGAMAAHVLVRKGIPVIMLESGQEAPSGLLVRAMGRTVYRSDKKKGMASGERHVPTGDPKTEWWTNLSPGGLSNQWTGAVPRFAPEDFCDGERLHERYRWPIDYEDLLPYYERAESLLWINGDTRSAPNLPAGRPAYRRRLPRDWQSVAKLAAERGQGLTATPVADGPPWLMVRRNTAVNSYTNIVQPLMRSPHFRLITGAHALQLEYSSANRRLTGVVYHDRDTDSRKRIDAAAVVVACGPLHSTKLLFDSACADFPQGLGNTRGILGKYLHDHPRDWWTFALERPLSYPVPSAYLTRLAHKNSPPLYATSWTIGLTPGMREKVRSMLPTKSHAFGVQVFGTTIPSEEHFVQPICSKRDEFGLPAMEICMRFDEEATDNVIRAREHLLGLLSDAGFPAKLNSTPAAMMPGSSVHYGGTIRMHRSPEYGMADEWNRLFEVPNVIVGDASCFTTGPEKNPTLTAMALAARAADRLAYDLKH